MRTPSVSSVLSRKRSFTRSGAAGDNFFALHLLNDADLQTLKRHNAHYNDEILSYIRSEPIPGNCFFWTAPNQPFVVSARVHSFEAICATARPSLIAPSRVEPARLAKLVAQSVQHALNVDAKVWILPVNLMFGRREAGLVACSQEYLRKSVSEQLTADAKFSAMPDQAAWLADHLPVEIKKVLDRHRVRAGFANLAGSNRAVWILPDADVELRKPKAVRDGVDVFDRL